jgi:hypothetical protein
MKCEDVSSHPRESSELARGPSKRPAEPASAIAASRRQSQSPRVLAPRDMGRRNGLRKGFCSESLAVTHLPFQASALQAGTRSHHKSEAANWDQ